MSAVATAFAILAVLAVLASATAAGVSYRGAGSSETDPSTDPTSGPTSGAPSSASPDEEDDEADQRFFPDGQVLTGDRSENANIEIPSTDEGWTYASGSSVLSYAREMSDGSLGVDDPYLYNDGFCTDNGVDYHRASVGFDRIGSGEGDDARAVAEDRVAQWQSLLFEDYGDPPADVDYSPITLSDGTPGVVATFDYVPRGDGAKCDRGTPAVEKRFLTFATGEGVAVVILTRDVAADGGDLEGSLSDADADALLAAARIQQDD